jgi:hypothetical protein
VEAKESVMKRLILASCGALIVLAPVLAFAQNRTPPAGGSTVGSAAPRGGESGGSSSAPSSGSSSSGSATERGGSSAGPGSNGGSFSSPVTGSSMRGSYAGPRSGEATAVARPRNGSPSVGQAVPVSERPRGDAPLYGKAIARSQVPAPNNGGIISGGYNGSLYPYYGYYDPYSWGWYWGWNWGYTGWYGNYGYGWPYYGYAWPGMPYYGWGMYALPMSVYSDYWYSYAGGAAYTTSTLGSIKFKVKPKEAEIYVDGTYYGQVDNYDGSFQHLDLPAGTHKVEIRANGYETLQTEIRVLPGKTITYPGELKPAKKN